MATTCPALCSRAIFLTPARDLQKELPSVFQNAALVSLKKRRQQVDIFELLTELKAAKEGPERWSRLYAILDQFDARSLSLNDDPLCIWPVVDKLPFEFTREAESVLKRRIKDEKSEASQIDSRNKRY